MKQITNPTVTRTTAASNLCRTNLIRFYLSLLSARSSVKIPCEETTARPQTTSQSNSRWMVDQEVVESVGDVGKKPPQEMLKRVSKTGTCQRGSS